MSEFARQPLTVHGVDPDFNTMTGLILTSLFDFFVRPKRLRKLEKKRASGPSSGADSFWTAPESSEAATADCSPSTAAPVALLTATAAT